MSIVVKGRSDESAAVFGEGVAVSMRRSASGEWSKGIPSEDELEDDFVPVFDANERTTLLNEAKAAVSSLNAAS